MGEKRKVYKVSVGKPEGKTPLGKPRCRWEDGIKMDLGQTGWVCVEWIHLAQDRGWWQALVNTMIDLRVLAPLSYLGRQHGATTQKTAIFTITLGQRHFTGTKYFLHTSLHCS
jgi:hypothetical protein